MALVECEHAHWKAQRMEHWRKRFPITLIHPGRQSWMQSASALLTSWFAIRITRHHIITPNRLPLPISLSLSLCPSVYTICVWVVWDCVVGGGEGKSIYKVGFCYITTKLLWTFGSKSLICYVMIFEKNPLKVGWNSMVSKALNWKRAEWFLFW